MKAPSCYSASQVLKTADFRNSIFERVAAVEPGRVWLNASTRDIKKVVVIAAASRSGSSLLFALLRKIPSVYSLSGESVPFYKLNGLSSDLFLSDEIPSTAALKKDRLSGLSRDLLSDASFAGTGHGDLKESGILQQYIDDLAMRFSLQWPAAGLAYDIFTRQAQLAYKSHIKTHKVFCLEEFYLELIYFLRQEYGMIDPYYYDIPAEKIKKKFPRLKLPCGPPQECLIEEPPFILLAAGKKIKKEDLAGKTLLLKSSADCYRLPFLKNIFPNADIKIVYLTRNPLGSVNGLYDGWLHRGFFSHNLREVLRKRGRVLEISGYSDRYEWGKWWWKYDLPPGWQEYMRKPLEEVCAFQWYSANFAIRRYLDLDGNRKKCCHVEYENITGSPRSRVMEINKIIDFSGLDKSALAYLNLSRMPVVQATERPRAYRWKKREVMLLPLLDDRKISAMAASMGYRRNNIKEWS